MNSLVQTIKSIIGEIFEASRIEDSGCFIDISNEKEPKLIIRYDPKRPNFGNLAKNEVRSPDFLFVSDYPNSKGRLFVIELSSGRNKSREDIKNQLSSGFEQLRHKMNEHGIKHFSTKPLVRAIYCGRLNRYTLDSITKKPIIFHVFGEKVRLSLLRPGGSFDELRIK